MSENLSGKKPSGQSYDFDQSFSDILGALEHIKRNMPNGELNAIKDKLSDLEQAIDEIKEESNNLGEMILDPEDGIIVKLNKGLEITRKYEEYRDTIIQKKIDSISQLESWKENVTKVLWILFAAIMGVILNMIFRGG